MKKIFKPLAFLAAVVSLCSCNDKLHIAAPYKDITVVYGLLDRSDTAHYIRIQKAFMDENQSAIDMAKIADSSFYASLSVSMKEIGPAGNVLNTFALTKVDLVKEGYTKDTGAFFNTPNYAYKFLFPLSAANQYRLIIKNTLTGNVDSAITPVINNEGGYETFGVNDWLRPTFAVSFPHEINALGKPDAVDYRANIPANVGAIQLILRFNWTDSNISTGVATHKSADFYNFTPQSAITSATKSLDMIAPTTDIYNFLHDALGAPATASQFRYMDSCDMILYVAGTEYQRYSDLNSNKGGLTADEIRPLYTNIKGANVMGLLSTRTFRQFLQIPLSSDTKDSLKANIHTRDLNLRFY